MRVRIAVGTVVTLISLGSSLAFAQGTCPSSNIDDVRQDPVVQEAIRNAWRDSHEGMPDEHEEGGWIQQCQLSNGDGTFRYYTQVLRWPPGTIDESFPSTPFPNPSCRMVADFHTHPGGRSDEGGDDTFQNWMESPADVRFSLENGLPGIIVWGPAGDPRQFTYPFLGLTEPRDPSWTCPGVPPRPGSGWGEPHLRTFDDVVYDVQAIGDFTLVRSASGDLEIQSRHEPYRDSTQVSVTTGLAVRDGDDRVEWHGGVFDPLINGRRRSVGPTDVIRLKAWGVLRRTDTGFFLATSAGDQIHVNVGNEYLDYVVRPAPQRARKVTGLLGNFDDDPDNDGQAIDQGRVPAGQSLFASPFASTIDVDGFPHGSPVPSSEAARAATAKCQTLQLRDAATRRACEFDLAVTGDEAFLASASRADDASVGPLATPEGVLSADRDVFGTLTSADERRRFSMTLDRGVYVLDARGSRDATWSVTGPRGAELLDANQSAYMGQAPVRVVITEPGRYAIAVSVRSTLTEARFTFRVRSVPVTPPREIAVGRRVLGRIERIGDEQEYMVTLPAGDFDFDVLRADDTAWNVTGADGRSLIDANQQEFMESVPGLHVAKAGTYRIAVRGRDTVGVGVYGFRIVAR